MEMIECYDGYCINYNVNNITNCQKYEMPQFIAKDRFTNFCLDYDSVISRQAPSNLNG
jgi:hypothetical protein